MSNFGVQLGSDFSLTRPLQQVANNFLQDANDAKRFADYFGPLKTDTENLEHEISLSTPSLTVRPTGNFWEYHRCSMRASALLGYAADDLDKVIKNKNKDALIDAITNIEAASHSLKEAKDSLRLFIKNGNLNKADSDACHAKMKKLNEYIERIDKIKLGLLPYDT